MKIISGSGLQESYIIVTIVWRLPYINNDLVKGGLNQSNPSLKKSANEMSSALSTLIKFEKLKSSSFS